MAACNLQILIITPTDGRKLFLSASVDERSTVLDVKRKICDEINNANISASNIRLIVAGVELKNDKQSLADLHIGLNTKLHALVCELGIEENKTIAENVSKGDDVSLSTRWKSQFYVYCKSCNKLQPGKLRMRCAVCKSGGILPSYEPSCWNDVLHNRISCRCLENGCENSRVTFYFKCVPCADDVEVAPLTQVKSNSDGVACSICDEIKNPLVQFPCVKKHSLCIHCFVLNGQITLEERNFVLEPNFGYTMTCPAGCPNSFIMDPHHFRLLGPVAYERYQKLSTEMYVLGEGGTFCPNPKCGAGFLPENNEAPSIVLLCPECKYSFCRRCKQRASECFCKNDIAFRLTSSPSVANAECSAAADHASDDSSDLKSYVAVQTTSKPCPKCKAPTFKDGGCNHISCSMCRFPWCWVCVSEWKDDCQWNHWFD